MALRRRRRRRRRQKKKKKKKKKKKRRRKEEKKKKKKEEGEEQGPSSSSEDDEQDDDAISLYLHLPRPQNHSLGFDGWRRECEVRGHNNMETLKRRGRIVRLRSLRRCLSEWPR